jgi:hypothetical protein
VWTLIYEASHLIAITHYNNAKRRIVALGAIGPGCLQIRQLTQRFFHTSPSPITRSVAKSANDRARYQQHHQPIATINQCRFDRTHLKCIINGNRCCDKPKPDKKASQQAVSRLAMAATTNGAFEPCFKLSSVRS